MEIKGYEQNYWIDLIGFDVNNKEQTLIDFIEKNRGRIDSLYLHIVGGPDFVAYNKGMDHEYNLSSGIASCFPHSNERDRQVWTNYDLRDFIAICHKHNVKVYFTFSGVRNSDQNWECLATEYPNLLLYSTRIAQNFVTYHFAKRLPDGTYLEDLLYDKLKKLFIDYDFDGVQLSDMVTFTQAKLVEGDYTDDLVEQFVSRTGIKLPFKITGTTIKEQQARCRYILSNLRYEWSCFIADRYGEFIAKMIKATHEVGKKTTLVNSWTCSPFESFYRFGIDYRKYINAGADKWMFEDAIGVTISGWRNNAMELDDRTRDNWMYRLMEKQGALKCSGMNVPVVIMTSLHDTNEQWDLINNAPNEFRHDMAKSSVTFVWKDGKLLPSHQGSIYCLSDCISQQTWDTIHDIIDTYYVGEMQDALGFTALYDEDLNSQLKEFITTRRHNAGYFNYEFLVEGLPITARTTKEELPKSRGPLLVCAESIRDKMTKEYLEKTERLLIVAGYKDVLTKQADATFKNEDLIIKVYNIGKKLNKKYSHYKKAGLGYQDPAFANWPSLPRMDKFDDHIIKDVVDFVLRNGNLPYGIEPYELQDEKGNKYYLKSYKKGRYKIFTYKAGENHYKMLITNVENHFVHPLIKFPLPVKKVLMVGKPEWCAPIMREGYIFVKVNNRGCELLDIYV